MSLFLFGHPFTSSLPKSRYRRSTYTRSIYPPLFHNLLLVFVRFALSSSHFHFMCLGLSAAAGVKRNKVEDTAILMKLLISVYSFALQIASLLCNLLRPFYASFADVCFSFPSQFRYWTVERRRKQHTPEHSPTMTVLNCIFKSDTDFDTRWNGIFRLNSTVWSHRRGIYRLGMRNRVAYGNIGVCVCARDREIETSIHILFPIIFCRSISFNCSPVFCII